MVYLQGLYVIWYGLPCFDLPIGHTGGVVCDYAGGSGISLGIPSFLPVFQILNLDLLLYVLHAP